MFQATSAHLAAAGSRCRDLFAVPGALAHECSRRGATSPRALTWFEARQGERSGDTTLNPDSHI